MSIYVLVKEKLKCELLNHCPIILKIYNYTLCDFLFGRVTINNIELTIDKLCSGKVSMSRFGDGEFDIMNGSQNGFQHKNKKLGKLLKNIIKKNGENSNFIVCIPSCFISFDNFTEDARKFLEMYYLKNRFKCYKYLNTSNEYYDSFVTRLYMDVEDKSKCQNYFNKMKSIWSGKDILIIEGNKSRLGVNNDLFKNTKSIERILAPAENAFDFYDEIYSAGVEYGRDEKLILLALGQTATALAYDLYQAGCWVLDIGHIDIEYEWFLNKSEKKEAIIGKYVNEVNHRNVEDIDDLEYEKQIILRIGVDE